MIPTQAPRQIRMTVELVPFAVLAFEWGTSTLDLLLSTIKAISAGLRKRRSIAALKFMIRRPMNVPATICL
jgi:hypothetical protein